MNFRFSKILIIGLWMLRCTPGTEVGNGIQKDPDTETKAETSASGTGSTNDSATPNTAEMPNSDLSPYLIVSCASPFAESIQGTFANGTGQPIFMVGIGTDSVRNLTLLTSLQVYSILPLPSSAAPYAIKPLPISPNLSCGTITTQTLGDGSTERTVLLSNESRLRWVLSSGKVISITVLNKDDSQQEKWTKSAE
jgi:hypothetical protein